MNSSLHSEQKQVNSLDTLMHQDNPTTGKLHTITGLGETLGTAAIALQDQQRWTIR
jgi:hypothetical protein